MSTLPIPQHPGDRPRSDVILVIVAQRVVGLESLLKSK